MCEFGLCLIAWCCMVSLFVFACVLFNAFVRCVCGLLCGVVWSVVVVSECDYVCVCLRCVLFVTYCVMLSGMFFFVVRYVCAACVCVCCL